MAEKKLKGLGVSAGVRIGKAFVYSPVRLTDIESRKTDDSGLELQRLQQAKAKCSEQLQALIDRAQSTLGEDKAMILKGQLSFLSDPVFYPPMEDLIAREQWTAETAVHKVVTQVAGLFESMANEYMRERAADVRDVGNRLFAQLSDHQGTRLSDIREQVILVADDLTPSDTVQLDKNLVLGFVTRIGGKTSHTAILANSLGISAVLGIGDGMEAIDHGDELIIDGSVGDCIVSPSAATIETFREQQQREESEWADLKAYANRAAVTKDGFRVELAANIGTVEESLSLLEHGAEAVGLYRTEFLFMGQSQLPDEETQYQAYSAVAEAMRGRPVVIRTLDIGGDKELPYLELPKEMNPFLGYRAIRIGLDRRELLLTQLKAIARAGVHGTVKIMFPMISGLEEWREAKAIYEQACEQLRQEGKPFADSVELGIMIEIPSAALMADSFAKEVDFFSIGTNDLVQYTVAVDRMNEKVSHLYDYFHPAVLRLVKQVIDASVRHGKWTGMCGTMAGDPLAAPLLVGLGLHEWSMSASSLSKVKKVIVHVNRSECAALAERVLSLDTAAEVRQALEAFHRQIEAGV
ncbi:phosphoenolpyruvate--protein phosphotransferase [Paenibacillus oleatilyticus]|uniref:phosphoenolpyruvate--protein phosphotransferase n=1 Tax=Paenibacillus oleatilyticus TaxID=2594886 RepID=UPI001C1F40B8|nr:phosphoenolpyruvate--protein phosphotransferase [Paenibacillus oleatilyticus]MBU7314981.1 phosphoenolpyruvate--protein phosphotransferase [Paenibacillus oleatilyticus]